MGGEPQLKAFGAVQPGAGQRQELRQPPAQPRQVTPAADVGEDADGGLRHRQHRPLGGDAVAAGQSNADAAAHGDAVHEGDARLGVGIFEVVEPVFVEEEGACRRFVPLDVLADADDVAAGTKATALCVIDQDNPHIRIVTPRDQRRRHVAHHLPVEAVQRPRAVEPQAAGQPLLLRQHIAGGGDRVHQGIIA